jgi:plasmid stabilization system protein ParE
MNHRLVFRRAAREELEDAFAWYEGQRQGLGEEFLTEIAAAIEAVTEHPQRYPLVFESVR